MPKKMFIIISSWGGINCDMGIQKKSSRRVLTHYPSDGSLSGNSFSFHSDYNATCFTCRQLAETECKKINEKSNCDVSVVQLTDLEIIEFRKIRKENLRKRIIYKTRQIILGEKRVAEVQASVDKEKAMKKYFENRLENGQELDVWPNFHS